MMHQRIFAPFECPPISASAIALAHTTIEEVGSIHTSSFRTIDPKIYNLDIHTCLDHIRAAWDTGIYPPSRVAIYHLENCFVVGEGLIFDSSFRLLREFLSQQSAEDIDSARNTMRHYHDECTTHFVERDAMVLVKPGYANYGHWLTELFVQPLFLRQANVEVNPILFVCDHPGVPNELYRDTLQLIGFTEKNVFLYDYYPKFFKSLYVVAGHSRHGRYMSPAVISALQGCKIVPRPNRPREKIYVRRGDSFLRKIANEKDISDLLGGLGFRTVNPDEMTFAEQLETFSGCEIAVGVAGAGLTNICWQPRNSACIGLYPASMPDTFFWWICQHAGIRFADIRCSTIGGDHWNADISVAPDILEKAIKSFIVGDV